VFLPPSVPYVRLEPPRALVPRHPSVPSLCLCRPRRASMRWRWSLPFCLGLRSGWRLFLWLWWWCRLRGARTRVAALAIGARGRVYRGCPSSRRPRRRVGCGWARGAGACVRERRGLGARRHLARRGGGEEARRGRGRRGRRACSRVERRRASRRVADRVVRSREARARRARVDAAARREGGRRLSRLLSRGARGGARTRGGAPARGARLGSRGARGGAGPPPRLRISSAASVGDSVDGGRGHGVRALSM
jgi:hypothetical protein